MPDLALTEYDGLALENLRNLIAASAEFRTATGTATEAEAKAFVYLWSEPDEFSTFFAVIGKFPGDEPDVLDMLGVGAQASHSGNVTFDLWGKYGDQDSLRNELTAFANVTSKIYREMSEARREKFDYHRLRVGPPLIEHEDERPGQIRFLRRTATCDFFGAMAVP